MERPIGTELSENGSSVKDLWFAVARLTSKAAIKAQQRVTDITPVNAGYYGVLGSYRTNVRLTGAPLNSADLRRIASVCKITN